MQTTGCQIPDDTATIDSTNLHINRMPLKSIWLTMPERDAANQSRWHAAFVHRNRKSSRPKLQHHHRRQYISWQLPWRISSGMRLVDDGRQRQRAQRHKTIIMSRLSRLLVMWCFAVAVIECAMASDESTNSSAIIRKRRYLDFIPKSRMFVRIANRL